LTHFSNYGIKQYISESKNILRNLCGMEAEFLSKDSPESCCPASQFSLSKKFPVLSTHGLFYLPQSVLCIAYHTGRYSAGQLKGNSMSDIYNVKEKMHKMRAKLYLLL
jgi:hypothetical protein